MVNKWGKSGNSDRFYLFSWAPKSLQMLTAAINLKDACSLEERLWANLLSNLKSRDITLSTKVYIIKAVIFPVVMYKCEIQALRKAEHQRTDYFEM